MNDSTRTTTRRPTATQASARGGPADPAVMAAHAVVAASLKHARDLLKTDARAARDAAESVLDQARRAEDVSGEIDALLLVGECCESVADFPGALTAFTKAAESCEALGDRSRLARALRSVGFVYDGLGDYARALSNLLRSLRIEEERGDVRGRAESLRTIGVTASKAGNPEEGLAYYRKCLDLFESIGDDENAARTLNNIGINLKNLGRYQESLESLSRALGLLRERKLTRLQAGCLSNVGRSLSLLGRAEEAEAAFVEAIALGQETGFAQSELTALVGQGQHFLQRGKHDAALAALTRAQQLAQRVNARPELADAHRSLSRLYKEQGDGARALEHFEAFYEVDKTIFNADSARRLRAMEVSWRLEQAKREAQLERKKNEELAEAYARLKLADVEKTRLLAELEQQSREDALTGLANRRHLDARLTDEFKRARRQRQPLAVAVFDVDHFKRINDTFSHAVGDATLREIGKLLRVNCREIDLVARYGGEEFVIAFVNLDRAGALAVCEKIRLAVSEHNWAPIHPDLRVTISAGVTDDAGHTDHERMLAEADDRLYAAKESGRNRVVMQ